MNGDGDWFDVHAWGERYREKQTREIKAKLKAEAERAKREADDLLHRQVLAGDPAAMRQFVEALATRHGISIRWRSGEWYSNSRRKIVSIPPPLDTTAFAICLHELSHSILGRCPRTGAHHRHKRGCLECERLAWEKATQLLPMDREMHERLRTALDTYRRSIPAPRSAKDSADRLMGSVREKTERQRRRNWQDKTERLARWKGKTTA